MDDISFQLDGTDAVLSNMDATGRTLYAKIQEAYMNFGIECQALAKVACPVDTGRLRASIAVDYTGNIDQGGPYFEVDVGTDVEYAPFVELGTKHMGARPFLFPAFNTATADLIEALQAILSGE